jgi:hypothetical protein
MAIPMDICFLGWGTTQGKRLEEQPVKIQLFASLRMVLPAMNQLSIAV